MHIGHKFNTRSDNEVDKLLDDVFEEKDVTVSGVTLTLFMAEFRKNTG